MGFGRAFTTDSGLRRFLRRVLRVMTTLERQGQGQGQGQRLGLGLGRRCHPGLLLPPLLQNLPPLVVREHGGKRRCGGVRGLPSMTSRPPMGGIVLIGIWVGHPRG